MSPLNTTLPSSISTIVVVFCNPRLYKPIDWSSKAKLKRYSPSAGNRVREFHRAAQARGHRQGRVLIVAGLKHNAGDRRRHIADGSLRNTARRVEVLVQERRRRC